MGNLARRIAKEIIKATVSCDMIEILYAHFAQEYLREGRGRWHTGQACVNSLAGMPGEG